MSAYSPEEHCRRKARRSLLDAIACAFSLQDQQKLMSRYGWNPGRSPFSVARAALVYKSQVGTEVSGWPDHSRFPVSDLTYFYGADSGFVEPYELVCGEHNAYTWVAGDQYTKTLWTLRVLRETDPDRLEFLLRGRLSAPAKHTLNMSGMLDLLEGGTRAPQRFQEFGEFHRTALPLEGVPSADDILAVTPRLSRRDFTLLREMDSAMIMAAPIMDRASSGFAKLSRRFTEQGYVSLWAELDLGAAVDLFGPLGDLERLPLPVEGRGIRNTPKPFSSPLSLDLSGDTRRQRQVIAALARHTIREHGLTQPDLWMVVLDSLQPDWTIKDALDMAMAL